MSELREVPVWLWICIAAVLLVQGIWLFLAEQQRGKGRRAWFWGIWGLTGFPSPAVCYLLFVVWPEARRRKQ